MKSHAGFRFVPIPMTLNVPCSAVSLR